MEGLIDSRAHPRIVPILRFFQNLKFLPIGQSIFQFSKLYGDQLKGILGDTRIEQIVPKAQIQQFSLPDRLFSHADLPLIEDDIRGRQTNRSLRLASRSILRFTYFKLTVPDYSQGQRKDSRISRPKHIDEQQETVRILQFVIGYPRGRIERDICSGIHASGLHEQYFVDSLGRTLGQQGHIVIDAIGKGIRDQPTAGKSMAFDQNDQRMDPYGLQTTGIQQGHIETGSQFVL